MRLFSGAHYEFIEKRKKAYVFSGTLIVVSLAAMVFNIFTLGSWLDYGVDFTGGSLVQVKFHKDVTAGDLRAALGGAQAPLITRFGEASEFLIRAPLAEGLSIDDVAAQVSDQLTAAFGKGTFEVESKDLVSAKVGGELQRKAAMAILFSFVLTLIYLAMRFELRFGMAAVVATIHDITITLGFLAAFRVQIDLPSVAAILTIVGYSLNDTIVVFDRIRENLNKKGGRRRDPVELLDSSVNETLPRTVLTSGTTIAVLVALLLLGGAVIRDFTLVLILGIVIGTYSSIFVATPALLEIQDRWGLGKSAEKKKKKPQAVPV